VCRLIEHLWRAIWASGRVVGSYRESELPVDVEQPAMPHLTQAGHRLGPAESFLDAFADALRDRIARMTGDAIIDRGAAAAGVLSDMRVTALSCNCVTKSALSY
jgi:hypothetical protein